MVSERPSLGQTLAVFFLAGPAISVLIFVLPIITQKGLPTLGGLKFVLGFGLFVAYSMAVQLQGLLSTLTAALFMWLFVRRLLPLAQQRHLARWHWLLCTSFVSAGVSASSWLFAATLFGRPPDPVAWALQEVAPTGAILGAILGFMCINALQPTPRADGPTSGGSAA